MGKPRRTYAAAVVTGASSGIGAAFARRLAAGGTRRLVLVARRAERLEALAHELRAAHDVQCEVFRCDLARAPEVALLAARLASEPIDLFVQDAGSGRYGRFTDLPLAPQLESIDLNVRAVVELSHAYLRAALGRGRGALLLVASTAGVAPVPYEAVYAATKSFVIHLGEALCEEVRGTRVVVRTLCPGFTETEFASVAGLPPDVVLQRGVRPDAVAATGLAALERGAPTAFHGRVTRIAGALGRVAPRRLVLRMVGRWMERGLTGRART
jgi:short-subunit dehydrogenase